MDEAVKVVLMLFGLRMTSLATQKHNQRILFLFIKHIACNMKKSALFFAALLFTAFSFTACNKNQFEDQIVGQWKSTSVKLDGSDVTSLFSLNILFEASKEFDAELKTKLGQNITSESYTGEWSENDDTQEVILTYDGKTNQVEKYDIIEITDNMMKAKTVVDGRKYEYTFEKQQ